MSKKQSEEPQPTKRARRLSQTLVPSVLLDEALRVARALRDDYALDPATPVDVGVAIGIAPTSGPFRAITGASIAYGLTSGGYNAQKIELTELGRRAVAPLEEGDDVLAMREAFEKPSVIGSFIDKYNGNKLPTNQEVVKNVLQELGVPRDRCAGVYDQILIGLESLGYLREVNGARFLQRPSDRGLPVRNPEETPEGPETTDEGKPDRDADGATAETDDQGAPPQSLEEPTGQERPNAIFLGHGKNRKPLEQLVKILDEYGIPHKEAIAEPNAGRPIPTKVAETMRNCGAAILIFSADEQLQTMEGDAIWRPSENVVHELGAASVLYDNRIIIFKESDVSLASNFSSIGYISFEKDKLSDKGIELFRELVSFKIVSISVSS